MSILLPNLRNRGYATACVAELSQKILDQGNRYACLFTDLANPPSNHIYHEIGYKPIIDLQVFRYK